MAGSAGGATVDAAVVTAGGWLASAAGAVLLRRTRIFSFSYSKSVKPCSITSSASSRSSSILNEGSAWIFCFFVPAGRFFSTTNSSPFAFADAVVSLIVQPPALALCGHLARIVHQLDHCHFGIVPDPPAKLDDARISAIAVFI